MNVWIQIPAQCNLLALIPLVLIAVSVRMVGGTWIAILVWTLMNATQDHTAALTTHGVPTQEGHTDVTACLVGVTGDFVLVLMLTNARQVHTGARVTVHDVLTPRAHTDATVYQVGENKVIIRVLTLMNVPKDGTAALPTLTALTHKAPTDATATAVFTNLEAVVIVSLS